MNELLLLVIVDSAIWAMWSFFIGFSFNKLPDKYLQRDIIKVSSKTQSRLEKVKIKSWKDLVPEAGAMFKGGRTKKSLKSKDREGVEGLVVESRRAEYVHFGIVLITPVFFFFNPPILIIAMVAYSVLANVPFIMIQRYNRSRCYKVLDA